MRPGEPVAFRRSHKRAGLAECVLRSPTAKAGGTRAFIQPPKIVSALAGQGVARLYSTSIRFTKLLPSIK